MYIYGSTFTFLLLILRDECKGSDNNVCLTYMLCLRRHASRVICRQWRTFSSEEVEQMGLTMSKLTPIDNLNSPLIEKYNTKGFTISGNKVYGSVALLPKAYFHWKVNVRVYVYYAIL